MKYKIEHLKSGLYVVLKDGRRIHNSYSYTLIEAENFKKKYIEMKK
jgi:hypothetical protein